MDNNMNNNTNNNMENNTNNNMNNNANNNTDNSMNNNMNNNTNNNVNNNMNNNMNNNTNNNMNNSMNNSNQTNQSPSTGNKLNNNSIIKIVGVIAVIVIVLLIGTKIGSNLSNGNSGGGSKMSANKYISYLPRDKSEYDAICTKEDDYGEDNMKISEVIGMRTMTNNKYVSYSFVNVVSRKDGKAIVENAENKEKLDQVVKSIEKTSLGVTGEFKDGAMVFKYGKSNYEYSNANDAKEYLRTLGYTCE